MWCDFPELLEPVCDDCAYYNAKRKRCNHPTKNRNGGMRDEKINIRFEQDKTLDGIDIVIRASEKDIVLLYIPVGLFLGWLNGLVEILIVAICQIIGFFIIWLIMNAIYKKQVKELNEMQKDFSERQGRQDAQGVLHPLRQLSE